MKTVRKEFEEDVELADGNPDFIFSFSSNGGSTNDNKGSKSEDLEVHEEGVKDEGKPNAIGDVEVPEEGEEVFFGKMEEEEEEEEEIGLIIGAAGYVHNESTKPIIKENPNSLEAMEVLEEIEGEGEFDEDQIENIDEDRYSDLFNGSDFSEGELLDVSPKEGVFSKIDNFYRVMVAGKGQSEAELVWKLEIERPQIYHLIQDFGMGKYCEQDLSAIDFRNLNDLFLKITGIVGTKESVIKFFYEKVSSEFAEKLKNESNEMKCGLYLWISDTEDRAGYLFLWEGEQSFFGDNPRRKPLCTLFRYIFEISADLILTLPPKVCNDFDENNTSGYDPEMENFEIEMDKVTKVEDKFEILENGIKCNWRDEKASFNFSSGNESVSFYSCSYQKKRVELELSRIKVSPDELFKSFKGSNIDASGLSLDGMIQLSNMFPKNTSIRQKGAKVKIDVAKSRINVEKRSKSNELKKNNELGKGSYKSRLFYILNGCVLENNECLHKIRNDLQILHLEADRIKRELLCEVCKTDISEKLMFKCYRFQHKICEKCAVGLNKSKQRSCPSCCSGSITILF